MRRPLALLAALVLVGLATWLLAGRSPSEHPAGDEPAGHEEEGHEEEEEYSNVFVADVGSGRIERRTANHGEDEFAFDPDWAPDGRTLIYAQVPCDDCEPYIQLVNATGPVKGPRRLGKGSHPSYFPDGRRFVYVGKAGGLYLGDVDGPAMRELAAPRHSWSEPETSPDGRRVAAIVQQPDGRARLAVFALPARRPRLLPAFGRSVVNPTWSPDGRRIAFAALDADGRWRLYAVGRDGSARRRLARAGSDTQPAWSPDGSRIAFVRTEGDRSAVFVARADGTGARLLFGRRIEAGQPAWSPDGTRLAFVLKGD